MLYVYYFGIAGLIRIRRHDSSLVAATYQFLQCALRRAQASYLGEGEDEDQVEEQFERSDALLSEISLLKILGTSETAFVLYSGLQ